MLSDLKAKLKDYVDQFNADDEELHPQLIRNAEALEYLSENIPLLDCPDKVIEKAYYFRWWTLRKHWKDTGNGRILTEFHPDVGWAGPHNSINAAVGHHLRESRWLKDESRWVKEYILFWLDRKGQPFSYSMWWAVALEDYLSLHPDKAFEAECLDKLIALYEERAQMNAHPCGLYWSQDGRDAMELSISGSGIRPTLNSYMYGDACAISRMAARQGNVRGFICSGTIEQNNFFISDAEGVAKAQDQQGQNRGLDSGQGNMPDLPQAIGAVHLCRFIQIRVNARDGGKINNTVPSEALPDAASDENGSEPLGIAEEIDFHPENLVKDTVDRTIRRYQIENHAADNDRGNEMRKIGNRLHHALESLVLDLIQHQREQNRHREAPYYVVNTDQQRIAQQSEHIRAFKEANEVIHANPRAAQNTSYKRKFLEGDHDAIHRIIGKYEEEDNDGQDHHDQFPVPS